MEGAVPYDTMRRAIAIAGGLAFVGSLLYFVASYGWRFDAPAEASGGTATAILVDLALFTAFALHHSIFARSPLKAWIRRIVTPPMERSAYVWLASVLFIATCAWWQPVPGTLWDATGAVASTMQALQIAAGVLCVVAARRLDVLELAGVRQVFGQPATSKPLRLDTHGPYALVRHPIYFGWILLVGLSPHMNGTRLVFAAVSTLYLAIAVPFEERDLVRTFGSMYSDYRRRVRWRMLPFVY
jgi:protein-S-isoprenylcysteine O-methyltransferase Ste14